MNKRQESKLGMYEAVLLFCTENGAIVALILAFSNGVAKLADILKAIKKTAQTQTSKGTGSANKQTNSDTLCDLTFAMASALSAYATEIGDGDLKQKVKYTLSDLKAMRDEDLPDTAQEIYDLAKPLTASLADFGVVPQDIKDLQDAIDAYNGTVANPTVVKGNKMTATQNLSDLYKSADIVLKETLDKTIVKYKKSHPDFYKGFKNVRKIIDAPTRHKKVENPTTNTTT